jgi:hypothetical protein
MVWWIVGSVVLAVVVILAIVLVVWALIHKRVVGAVDTRLSETVPADEIVLKDTGALTFGVESRGKWQGRGNGALVLTDAALIFLRLWPADEIRIPRADVTAVTTPLSHLGKSYGRPLLKVAFTSASGAPDSIALFVQDLPAWLKALEVPPRAP